jgi:hypothetical protein
MTQSTPGFRHDEATPLISLIDASPTVPDCVGSR